VILAIALITCVQLSSSPSWAKSQIVDKISCVTPPYMKDDSEAGLHYHPKIRVLLYKRNPGISDPLHYPVHALRPDPRLGVEPAAESPTKSAPDSDDNRYRDIHSHDKSGTLHVEHNSRRPYRLCDLIELWRESREFQEIWDNNAPGSSAHIWIDGYHFRHIRFDELLRIPLNHDMSITICIEQGLPI